MALTNTRRVALTLRRSPGRAKADYLSRPQKTCSTLVQSHGDGSHSHALAEEQPRDNFGRRARFTGEVPARRATHRLASSEGTLLAEIEQKVVDPEWPRAFERGFAIGRGTDASIADCRSLRRSCRIVWITFERASIGAARHLTISATLVLTAMPPRDRMRRGSIRGPMNLYGYSTRAWIVSRDQRH